MWLVQSGKEVMEKPIILMLAICLKRKRKTVRERGVQFYFLSSSFNVQCYVTYRCTM